MSKPTRVQLRRAKGWRMPDNTVKVDRTTRWGNPYPVTDQRSELLPYGRGAEESVAAFRRHMNSDMGISLRELAPKLLRGKNLACWCKPDQPCHADVLLELANAREHKP